MRWVFAVLAFSIAATAVGAAVFSGSGAHELLAGDSVVLENNSSIEASAVSADYVYLEFFGPYHVRKLALDLFEKDFGKSTRVDAAGLKFSVRPAAKIGGAYAALLDASVLKANVALETELKPTPAKILGAVSASDLVSKMWIENTGDLALQNVNAVFALVRNGEEIFYSENVSAAPSLAPGESAQVRVENASWPLIPANPDKPGDNFSIRIVVARNQFEETDYADNELVIPINYAAPTPTPAATPTATTATAASTEATATPVPTPEATGTPAGAETPGSSTLLLIGAVVFLAILAAAAVFVLRKPPQTPPKPKKG